MTVVLSAFLFAGMPSGLAAYLQADIKGWKPLIGFLLVLLAGSMLMLWAALDVPLWNAEAVAQLKRDPRVVLGGVLGGVMVWAVLGAIVGKVFERSVAPVRLGLRTVLGASMLHFVVWLAGVGA